MEYCNGGDLSSALAKGRATPPGFTLMAAAGVAAGMAHLHLCGVLHRDLKGANVLLDDAGGVKLTDFGVAAQAPDDAAVGGMLTAETGTYRWMAPEAPLRPSNPANPSKTPSHATCACTVRALGLRPHVPTG